jgi:hypothetical protein
MHEGPPREAFMPAAVRHFCSGVDKRQGRWQRDPTSEWRQSGTTSAVGSTVSTCAHTEICDSQAACRISRISSSTRRNSGLGARHMVR